MSVGRMQFEDYLKTYESFVEETSVRLFSPGPGGVTPSSSPEELQNAFGDMMHKGALLLASVEINVLRDIFDTFEARMASDTAAHIRARIEKLQKEAGIEVGIADPKPVREAPKAVR